MENNIEESKKAQKNFCKENDVPHFAPESGICWSCNRNIYLSYEYKFHGDIKKSSGISVKKAGKELITGCPHCNRSYCD